MKYRVAIWINDEKLSLVQLAHSFDSQYITWAVKNHPGTLFDDVNVAKDELEKYMKRTNQNDLKTEIRSIR